MSEGLAYGNFAYVYDLLTDDVEYEARTAYVDSIIKRYFDGDVSLVCDLGCGTGTVCTMLTALGYECIGVDISEEMLSVASQKNADCKVLYLNQDITDFELYGTVDVFVSMLDTVNYILDDDGLNKMFKLIHNYLNPDGLFIFDVNTLYKFEKILGNNTYVFEKDNIFYTWENEYEDGILDLYLNFFVECEDDKYSRFTETHTQKYYSSDYLCKLAEKNGFEVKGVFSDLTFNNSSAEDERIFFVLKKN